MWNAVHSFSMQWGKRSGPNCDKNGCKCEIRKGKLVTLGEKLSVIHFTCFRVTR
jgi:hypothetical protein